MRFVRPAPEKNARNTLGPILNAAFKCSTWQLFCPGRWNFIRRALCRFYFGENVHLPAPLLSACDEESGAARAIVKPFVLFITIVCCYYS